MNKRLILAIYMLCLILVVPLTSAGLFNWIFNFGNTPLDATAENKISINNYSIPKWNNIKSSGDESNLTLWTSNASDKKTEIGFIIKDGKTYNTIDKLLSYGNGTPILDDKDKNITLKYETAKCDGQDCYYISLTTAQAVNIDDTIKLGEQSIVIVYEEQEEVIFSISDTENISAKLYWDINGDGSDWNNTVNDLFVNFNESKWKFGATHNNITWERYKYVIESDVAFTREDNKYVFQSEIKYPLDVSDICNKQLDENNTADCKFNPYTKNGKYFLEIEFWSDSNIDPTFEEENKTLIDNGLIHEDDRTDCGFDGRSTKCVAHSRPINILKNNSYEPCNNILDYELNNNNLTFDFGDDNLSLEWTYDKNNTLPFFTIDRIGCSYYFTQNIIDDTVNISELKIKIPEGYYYNNSRIQKNNTELGLDLSQAINFQGITITESNGELIFTGENISRLDPVIATNIAGTGTNAGSGDIQWTNPSNIVVNDSSYAEVDGEKGDQSYLLQGKSFGYAMDERNTINGIEVDYRYLDEDADNTPTTSKLLKSGVEVGLNRLFTPAIAVDTTVILGNSTDLWGTTWLPADINNASFGTSLSVELGHSTPRYFRVYAVWTRIYYDEYILTPTVTHCGQINESGTYTLQNDILNQDETCILINASDVIFEGGDYTIDGTLRYQESAIEVVGAQTNITIKNIKIQEFDRWIYGTGMSDSFILNVTTNTLRATIDYGIYIGSSNVIDNLNASDFIGRAIRVDDYNLVNNSHINCRSTTGHGMYLQYNNFYNTFTNSIIENCASGIGIFHAADSNYIYNNTFTNNTNGIKITNTGADLNEIYGNIFNGSGVNSIIVGSNNFLNTTQTATTSIIGGANSGGNFWTSPGGNYSDTCSVTITDNICDNPYNASSSLECIGCTGYNIDELPLSYKTVSVEGDTEYPIFTNIDDNNGTLIDSGTVIINSTITHTNGTAGVEFDGTNYTATNTSDVFNTSFSKSPAGVYSYFFWAYGNGTSTNFNKTLTQSYTINATPDLEYPLFTNLGFNITNGTEYFGGTYLANATITSTNGSAGIEFNGINYTTTNISDLFSANLNKLSAGDYNYLWWAYGSGTDTNFNNSETFTYTINKNNSYILDLTATTPITYGATTNFVGSGCPTEISCSLNISNAVYGAGTISANYSTAGNNNYTANSTTFTITINKENGVVSTFLNGTQANFATNNDTIVNLTGILNIGVGNINLTVDGVQREYGSNTLVNLSLYLEGTYIINTSYLGNENFTQHSESWTLTITNTTTTPTDIYDLFIIYNELINNANKMFGVKSNGEVNVTYNLSVGGNIMVSNLVTGNNAGSSICIDVNNRICACGSCA